MTTNTNAMIAEIQTLKMSEKSEHFKIRGTHALAAVRNKAVEDCIAIVRRLGGTESYAEDVSTRKDERASDSGDLNPPGSTVCTASPAPLPTDGTIHLKIEDFPKLENAQQNLFRSLSWAESWIKAINGLLEYKMAQYSDNIASREDGWLPIESAPKDKVILGGWQDHNWVCMQMCYVCGEWR